MPLNCGDSTCCRCLRQRVLPATRVLRKIGEQHTGCITKPENPFSRRAVQPSGDVGRPGLLWAQRLARRGLGRFPTCGCGDVSLVPARLEAELDDLGACSRGHRGPERGG